MARSLEDLLPILADLAAERAERRSLAELARRAGSSPSTFQRAFSRIIGESPKQYTLRLQLELAALRLINTEESVLMVALEAGFESHEGFTRAFSRQFGLPPKSFRGLYAGLADPGLHSAIFRAASPCLRLYRSPIDPKENTLVNYDITRQAIPEATFLYQSARCPHAEIAANLGKILPAVFGYAAKNGIELRSPPTTLYAEWGPGLVTLQAGMFVAAAEPDGDFQVVQLPASEALVTLHTGPYDSLGEAHAALEQFMDAEGLSSSGPCREIYLTDPGEVPDPKDWKTQLVWPVRE